MPCKTLNYTKCAVIVHGKSEFHLIRFIYTNLHLPVKIISKDKGRGSIQINGLKESLNKKHFRALKVFADEYSVKYGKTDSRYVFPQKNYCVFPPNMILSSV